MPPVTVWAFSCVFLFPKLKQIWRDTGFDDSTVRGFMGTSDFFVRHGVFIAAFFFLLLILLEWRNPAWPRYRRASVSVLVFLLNSAVLVSMMATLISVLLFVPGLLPRK